MAKLMFPADKVRADSEAEANIAQIVNDVAENPEGRFLITKNGDPSVVIVNVNYIENLLGDSVLSPNQPPSNSQLPPPPPSAPLQSPPPNLGDFMVQPS